IYARASNVTDRYASFAASFGQWAADVDMIVNASAAETGGTRHVRFLTDPSCNPMIDRVTFSTTGDDNMSNTISELRSRGYNRSDRKYLVWVDANVYCGIAQVYWDDSQNPAPGANYSNGHPQVAGEVARVDNGCWGFGGSVEAHELMHNLGGVQTSAPNSTPSNHCRDESDRMCYVDGPDVTMESRCPSSHESRFDCNHDDYFHTNPPAGSYLATHWNTASSVFLASSAGGLPPPASTTTAAPVSAEPGDPIAVSATGAQPSVAYGLRMAGTAASCGTGLRLGAAVNSDATGSIPATTRIIPTVATSGLRYLCFVRQSDATQLTAPTALTVV
ncbi:MAG: hypothetical protein LC733_02845, partial [Actinobacteria bacterium]|nr:hypothetical protein [Actinomycetota bacterium]